MHGRRAWTDFGACELELEVFSCYMGDPGSGIGGYDLASSADRAFAFDYDSSGKKDHLALYRPGTGTMWILKNTGGTFSPVYSMGDPGSGIGGYDLASSADRAFAFDYYSNRTPDHMALYRPGTGTFWILFATGVFRRPRVCLRLRLQWQTRSPGPLPAGHRHNVDLEEFRGGFLAGLQHG